MDSMNMYEVWTAGMMIAGMCARFGKSGKYEHLGECSVLVRNPKDVYSRRENLTSCRSPWTTLGPRR